MDVPAHTNPTWLIEASKTTTHSDSYTNNPIICYQSLEKTPLKSSNGIATPEKFTPLNTSWSIEKLRAKIYINPNILIYLQIE